MSPSRELTLYEVVARASIGTARVLFSTEHLSIGRDFGLGVFSSLELVYCRSRSRAVGPVLRTPEKALPNVIGGVPRVVFSEAARNRESSLKPRRTNRFSRRQTTQRCRPTR